MRRATPRRILSLAGLVAALFAAGCVGAEDSSALDVTGSSALLAQAGYAKAEISSDPNPIVRGSNDFLVRLTPKKDESQAVTLVSASAFMPAHGHGTTAPPSIREEGSSYRVADVGLSMPGRWEITLDLDASGTPDTLRFSVEVP